MNIMVEKLAYEFDAPSKDGKPVNGLFTQGMADVVLKVLLSMEIAGTAGTVELIDPADKSKFTLYFDLTNIAIIRAPKHLTDSADREDYPSLSAFVARYKLTAPSCFA